MGVHKITVLAVAAMVFAGGAGAEDATPPRAALGRITFALSCAVCHGQTATGEGAMSSDLAVPAPDLTLLSVRNGGTFPAERVTEIIFGGAAVTVHGGQMPAWGLLFLKDFEAPDAKFVLATLGESTKGSTGNGGKVLDAQLAVDGTTGKYPEFKGNVATVYANPLSLGGSGNGHYNGNAETYMNVGEAMGQAMVELLQSK